MKKQRDFIGYRSAAGVIRRRLQLDGYDHSSLEQILMTPVSCG